MGPFFGGNAPRSSPRGGLGFGGKAESPFSFINLLKTYICVANWGVGYVNNKRSLEILRVEVTKLLDVPSVGEVLAVLVG
jgi:hypothetical protein